MNLRKKLTCSSFISSFNLFTGKFFILSTLLILASVVAFIAAVCDTVENVLPVYNLFSGLFGPEDGVSPESDA